MLVAGGCPHPPALAPPMRPASAPRPALILTCLCRSNAESMAATGTARSRLSDTSQAVGLVPHHGAAQPALSEEVDSDGGIRLQARQGCELRSGGRRRARGERAALSVRPG